MKTPYQLMKGILNCFGSNHPESIILGGSYATNEQGVLSLNKKTFALSDFDLLCVSNYEYPVDEKLDIYRNMLLFSKSIPQENPYFHIGLKMRTRKELQKEAESLYFKELSQTGKTLIGCNFNDYFSDNTVFGFNHLQGDLLYSKLYLCGLTRLWCNILFFPIKAFESKTMNVWYSYFLCRGAMDWITFILIENGVWKPTYAERFEIWKKEFADKTLLNTMQQCFEMKTGKQKADFREMFNTIILFSFQQISEYQNKISSSKPQELRFIISMLQFINHYNSEKKCNKDCILIAKNCLAEMLNNDLFITKNLWQSWHILRCLYSDFRFSLNEGDKIDHQIYTDNFLQLGNI
jgi:hypothetical protein